MRLCGLFTSRPFIGGGRVPRLVLAVGRGRPRPLGQESERDERVRAARDLVAAPGVVRAVAERVEAVLHGHDLQSAVRLRGLGDDAADGELGLCCPRLLSNSN